MLETSKSEQNIGQKSCAEEQGEQEDKKSLGGRKQKDDSTGSATLGGWVGGSNNDDTILLPIAAFDAYFIIAFVYLKPFFSFCHSSFFEEIMCVTA